MERNRKIMCQKKNYKTRNVRVDKCEFKRMIMKKQKKDNVCGQTCEVYSRIVGYYRPVQNWNKGKTEEFKDRIVYKNGIPANQTEK